MLKIKKIKLSCLHSNPSFSTCQIRNQVWCCMLSCSVVSDSLRPHGQWPIRLLCPWDSPCKNTGVRCYALLQRIFLAQGSKPGIPNCRQILYQPSQQGSSTVTWFLLCKMGNEYTCIYDAISTCMI